MGSDAEEGCRAERDRFVLKERFILPSALEIGEETKSNCDLRRFVLAEDSGLKTDLSIDVKSLELGVDSVVDDNSLLLAIVIGGEVVSVGGELLLTVSTALDLDASFAISSL